MHFFLIPERFLCRQLVFSAFSADGIGFVIFLVSYSGAMLIWPFRSLIQ